jgi:hypothetical protein
MPLMPRLYLALSCLVGPAFLPTTIAADDTVSTAVFSRVSKEYQRTRLPDGSFKPEYFAIANGGMVPGTSRDKTVEQVNYPNIVQLVLPQLAKQGYHYAKDSKHASLLLVLHWGNTISYNDVNYRLSLEPAGQAMARLQQLKNAGGAGADLDSASAELEQALMSVQMQNLIRNQFVAPNARLLGYIEDINESNDIRRFAGGGQRYADLMADVEEPRYYIVISAYDFREATQHNRQKLQWVTRVSVATPGNRFDDSVAAMLKNAAHYFGRDSGRLIRGEETKGTVDLGDLKFLGEAMEAAPTGK